MFAPTTKQRVVTFEDVCNMDANLAYAESYISECKKGGLPLDCVLDEEETKNLKAYREYVYDHCLER